MSGAARIGDPGPRPAHPGPRAVYSDIRQERQALRRMPLPPGENRFSFRNTWRFRRDVLNLLLENYERHGPIFGFRILFWLQPDDDRPGGQSLRARLQPREVRLA